MRALFGIAVMQRVIASPMQAARSSAVGLLTLASAAVETPPSSKPTAANIPVQSLDHGHLPRAHVPPLTSMTDVVPSPPETICDGDHSSALLHGRAPKGAQDAPMAQAARTAIAQSVGHAPVIPDRRLIRRALSPRRACLTQLHEPCRENWRLGDMHLERLERILDRRNDGSRGGNHSALADTFDSKGI